MSYALHYITRPIQIRTLALALPARLGCPCRLVFIVLTPRTNSGASNKGLEALTWTVVGNAQSYS